jgi:Polyketide cyclase / dehydrase and lipid transport
MRLSGFSPGSLPGRFREPRRGISPAVAVDVTSEIEIAAPRAQVAAYAADPDSAAEWYENIKSVEWLTPPPLAVGAQIAFVATFLGRRIAYTYEVREHAPGERFVMSTAEGPFPMETTYTWADAADGGTLMSLRNRGEPAGFAKVTAPVMARAIRRANGKDLERLKAIVEDRLSAGELHQRG